MKCKEIQGKVNLQFKNKKRQKLKEKGITLIALVVTIIILLILAGVTLNMTLSGDGLFSKARNVADKYKKAQEDEEELISEIGKEMNGEYVGTYITGYEPTEGTCTIAKEQSGADSSQTFTTEKDLQWRIWDYDGTTLRIILDRPTTQTLMLEGAEGYNCGVWAINEICRKCFGKYEGDKMKEGINVASLRRSDIQKVINYDYTKYNHILGAWEDLGNKVTEGAVKFGEEKEYIKEESTIKCPALWNSNDKDWKGESDKKCLIWEKEVYKRRRYRRKRS